MCDIEWEICRKNGEEAIASSIKGYPSPAKTLLTQLDRADEMSLGVIPFSIVEEPEDDDSVLIEDASVFSEIIGTNEIEEVTKAIGNTDNTRQESDPDKEIDLSEENQEEPDVFLNTIVDKSQGSIINEINMKTMDNFKLRSKYLSKDALKDAAYVFGEKMDSKLL